MEEKTRKQGRMEATFQGGQGPEGAVVPWMDAMQQLIYKQYVFIIYLSISTNYRQINKFKNSTLME
jgi:hypothetical protein